jgi:hypothetical protein
MALTSRYSSSPHFPPSRPFPDCLKPPKEVPPDTPLPLTSTPTDLSCRATLLAFSLS